DDADRPAEHALAADAVSRDHPLGPARRGTRAQGQRRRGAAGVVGPHDHEGVSARPRIGITCSPLRVHTYYDAYVHAIEQAGGEPVRIRPLSGEDDSPALVAELIGTIDGMLFPGGMVLDPRRYGQAREQETPNVDPALDHTEPALARAAAD